MDTCCGHELWACVVVAHFGEREFVWPEAVLLGVLFALTARVHAGDEVGVTDGAVVFL